MLEKRLDDSRNILTINLKNISENWIYLKSKINQNCICGAVIKANAYGLGAKTISKTLKELGCNNFLVATLEEGVNLRKAIGNKPNIIVMHEHINRNENEFLNYNLIPTLNTIEQIKLWNAFLTNKNKKIESIIQVDTGMNRLGVSINQITSFIESSNSKSLINPLFLMTHLACASTPENELNKRQLIKFSNIFNKFKRQFPSTKGTIANSAGILLGHDWHFDMVRTGAALYGINPIPKETNPLKQAVNLRARILQIRQVDSKETVGYGATIEISKNTKLATVSLGYANGFHRSLSNIGKAHINGIEIKVAGIVSMDLITFDVSNVPEGILEKYEWVDIISPIHTLDELAYEASTISYELLTALGANIKKEYVT